MTSTSKYISFLAFLCSLHILWIYSMHMKRNFKSLMKYLPYPIFFIGAASEHYWERVADRQRVKLDNVYDENMALKDQIKKLNEQIDILREKNRVQEEMLKETRALVEVLQVMLIVFCTNILCTILLLL